MLHLDELLLDRLVVLVRVPIFRVHIEIGFVVFLEVQPLVGKLAILRLYSRDAGDQLFADVAGVSHDLVETLDPLLSAKDTEALAVLAEALFHRFRGNLPFGQDGVVSAAALDQVVLHLYV